MLCIFCLNERPGSEEHIFPRSIGGTLTINRICKPCNSVLGSRVDVALSDNFLVRAHRARLNLTGNSGKIPAMHEMMLGVGRLANHPEQRVEITFDERTQQPILKALHHASDVIMPDGTMARHIIVDEKDAGDLRKIIQRERKRHGVSPLSDQALQEEIEKFKSNMRIINNPVILLEKTLDFSFVRHAMIKIAYELAFLWLGEDYLDDPSSSELREAVFSNNPNSTDKLPAYVADAEGFQAFKLWPASETEHLAYAFAGEDGIAIAVRVFNIHAAFVWVTKQTARFLSDAMTDQKLRFIRIDALTGKIKNIPIREEFMHIAAEMVSKF